MNGNKSEFFGLLVLVNLMVAIWYLSVLGKRVR